MRQYDAELVEQSTKLIDVHDANPDQLLTDPVHRQHGLLIFGLDCDEPHARALGGFPDCGGISRIVLVRLHERSYELGRYEPHVVAESCQSSGPMMSAAASFHDDAACRPVRKERHELRTFERLAVNRAGLRIDVVNLENALGQIDGDGRGFHLVLLDGEHAEPAMSHAPVNRTAATDDR